MTTRRAVARRGDDLARQADFARPMRASQTLHGVRSERPCEAGVELVSPREKGIRALTSAA